MHSKLPRKIVKWFSKTNSNARVKVLKRLVKECGMKETKKVMNWATKHKKAIKRKTLQECAHVLKLDKQEPQVIIPSGLLGSSCQVVIPGRLRPASFLGPEPISRRRVISKGEEPCRKIQKPIGWWGPKSKIAAFDVEMVSLHKKNSKGKHIMQAATVAVVDFDGVPIYKGNVYHPAGSYIEHPKARAVTGFSGTLLGESPEKVAAEVKKVLQDKLVIYVGGDKDFESLGLTKDQFNAFDLQHYFKNWKGQITNGGQKVYQSIGLEKLYHHYFKKSIQSGVHSAEVDAAATMRLFREIYIPDVIEKRVEDQRDYTNYEQFELMFQ